VSAEERRGERATTAAAKEKKKERKPKSIECIIISVHRLTLIDETRIRKMR
jgi:hypothetical protein